MEDLAKLIAGFGVPEPFPWLIVNIILASIIAVVAPSSLIILTWLERKIIARIQDRLGPNRAGPYGLLQGVADMIKMFTKEDITPKKADYVPYNIAPALSVFSSIMAFAVIPFAPGWGANLNVALLYIIAIGGLGTLAILMGGWASNNKYALLGAYRVVAMLLTYEIPMVMALVIITVAAGSMSMGEIVTAQGQSTWYILSMPLAFLIFFLAGVAETGRCPFDLIEAESELIAGFHTEYSAIKFGMFMIGEYVHMFVLSFFCAVLFMGGWQIPFINLADFGAVGAIIGVLVLLAKVFFFVFIMMWFRGTLPRFRIDHLLDFGWKFLVPLSLALLIGVSVVSRLFSPGGVDSSGATIPPGPLGGMPPLVEAVALLAVNLGVAFLAMLVVKQIAANSRAKALRAVSALEPLPGGKAVG
jgi:NADH-quinone oxidoreductase subunit H